MYRFSVCRIWSSHKISISINNSKSVKIRGKIQFASRSHSSICLLLLQYNSYITLILNDMLTHDREIREYYAKYCASLIYLILN